MLESQVLQDSQSYWTDLQFFESSLNFSQRPIITFMFPSRANYVNFLDIIITKSESVFESRKKFLC